MDYSPTGQEIVTGAYDRSIRIFRASDGHSRDIYHTRRMQRYAASRDAGERSGYPTSSHASFRPPCHACTHAHSVFCVRFSMDAKYVVSGSDDANLRLWKARASEKLGTVRALALADDSGGGTRRTKAAAGRGGRRRRRVAGFPGSRRVGRCACTPPTQLVPRERAAIEYSEALKERFKNLPEIKRISR